MMSRLGFFSALLWSASIAFALPTLNETSDTETFETLVAQAKTHIAELTVDEFKTFIGRLPAFVLIDVREDSEWSSGHAKGAVHIGRGVLERDVSARVPDKTSRLILYCGSGARSALAAQTLKSMGYANVYSMAGGFAAYKSAGLPVER